MHARYRGRETRRADIVRRSAAALSTLPGVGEFEHVGVEDIRAEVTGAENAVNLLMALLSDGNWALGVGITQKGSALDVATKATRTRPAQVKVGTGTRTSTTAGQDIEAAFALISHVFQKRTVEGREATSLMRRGLNQNEAAEELGISKQAMSQRLQAAGWHAEQQGWSLAVHLISRASTPEGE